MTVSDVATLSSAVTGFIAAFYWYRASKVEVKRVWEYDPADPTLKPKNMTQDSWQIANALEAAFFHSSSKNKVAAIWTAVSVGLGALSIIVSKWS